MGGLTEARPAEAYEIAGIQALQGWSDRAGSKTVADSLLPLLAMSVLSECGGLHGEALRARVCSLAKAMSSTKAADFLCRAASGFARCSDAESAAELAEAAAIARLPRDGITSHSRRTQVAPSCPLSADSLAILGLSPKSDNPERSVK